MRLLRIDTLELETFVLSDTAPRYAILSHTWGENEVSFQDLQLPREALDSKRGWKKIVGFRDAVRRDTRVLVSYIWVDTCCIDKTSSAELSEAINSMFGWYKQAACCYALLEDVEANAEIKGFVGDDFEASRWFRRGWTLQELLAPIAVHYFDRNWALIGNNDVLAQRISRRTSIPEDVIRTGEWHSATVAQRFSWMAGRETTRPEDLAYCLLGIFDVNMPMLYGEGKRAFIRLQEEIIKESDDQSIFSWDATHANFGVKGVGVLASHPRYFNGSGGVECLPDRSGPYVLTNKGLQITLPVIELAEKPGEEIALLACSDANDASSRIGIRVQADEVASTKYTRLPGPPVIVPTRNHDMWQNSMRSIYLSKRDRAWPGDLWHWSNVGTIAMFNPKADAANVDGSIISTPLFKLPDREATFCLVLAFKPSAFQPARARGDRGPGDGAADAA